jgi:hypothetical protein
MNNFEGNVPLVSIDLFDGYVFEETIIDTSFMLLLTRPPSGMSEGRGNSPTRKV